jgi:hypothetical protein
MVGNVYSYTLDNWLADISLAHSSGIDGFALNVGSDAWQPQQVANAYVPAYAEQLAFDSTNSQLPSSPAVWHWVQAFLLLWYDVSWLFLFSVLWTQRIFARAVLCLVAQLPTHKPFVLI